MNLVKFLMMGLIGLLLISCDSPNEASEKQVSEFNKLADEIDEMTPTLNIFSQAIQAGRQFSVAELDQMQKTTESYISKIEKLIHIHENPKSGVITFGDINKAKQARDIAYDILNAIKSISAEMVVDEAV